MTIVAVKETIAASADAVWQILGDFGGIKVAGPITAFEIKGAGVGAVRTITLGGARIVERLEAYDPATLSFTYVITNDDCPLPVSNYSATVKISRAGESACDVEWTGTFEPKGAPEDQARAVVTGIYTGGIAGARKALVG
jgi:hypothetical protein